jgi:hypothetical protein
VVESIGVRGNVVIEWMLSGSAINTLEAREPNTFESLVRDL